MSNQESKVYNAYETTLGASLSALADNLQVVAPGPVAPLTYLVIEPDDPAQREVVLVGTVVGNVFGSLTRYLSGSAAASGLAHPSGSVVRSVAVQQMWEDAHDRIDFYANHANLTGLAVGNPHSQYMLNTLANAKGDLLAASGNDAFAALAAGIDGTVLTASAGEPTGLVWSSPFVFSGAQLYNSVAQNAVAGVNQLLTWDSEAFDTAAYHASASPSRLTIPVAGHYEVAFKLWFAGDISGTPANAVRIAILGKNGENVGATGGTFVVYGTAPALSTVSVSVAGSIILPLLAADYLELYAQGPTGAQTQQVAGAGMRHSHFRIRRLG